MQQCNQLSFRIWWQWEEEKDWLGKWVDNQDTKNNKMQPSQKVQGDITSLRKWEQTGPCLHKPNLKLKCLWGLLPHHEALQNSGFSLFHGTPFMKQHAVEPWHQGSAYSTCPTHLLQSLPSQHESEVVLFASPKSLEKPRNPRSLAQQISSSEKQVLHN